MSEYVASQEDQLVLPASWRAKLLPRRGKRAGKRVTLAGPEQVEQIRRNITEHAEQLRAALANPLNDDYAAAGEAYLDGRPDPLGAAVVSTLMTDPDKYFQASWLRPDFDVWVHDHGLAFAICAAIERSSTETTDTADLRTTAIEQRRLIPATEGSSYLLHNELRLGVIADLRSLLARVSDSEYAEIVAAVAAHRDTETKRLGAMLLLPDEQAWTLEACTDRRTPRIGSLNEQILWLSVSTTRQVEAAGLSEIGFYGRNLETVAALLDGLGAEALPYLFATNENDEHAGPWLRGILYQAIGLVPDDDAVAYLLERLDHLHVYEFAAGAAARFPVRTLRVAARLAPASTTEQRFRLAAVAALPDAELRVHLSEEDRAALDDLLTNSGRVPDAAPEELPPLLVAPPWIRKRPKASLEPRFVKVPKPKFWAAPVLLPQVLLKGGERALPDDSVRHLITVLALATPDHPYPELQIVDDTCDRASLTRFSRALFQQWLRGGAPSKEGWALTQLAHFADDATVWALAALVRQWPGQNQHKRAVTGLEVLGAIGTEEALRAIQGIADKVKFKALKEEARRQITAIAEGLGLSREQLADRLVSEFGLGEANALVIDYGTRKFNVAFDEQLKPLVTDEDGKRRKALPKPGAKDELPIAEEAYRRFTTLQKELRTVAADQVSRLEAAMVAARPWSREEFRRFFVEHALTKHLARRLVWLAETDGSRFAFRIAEDQSFSDVEDDTVELPEDARIRVAHPVHLGSEGAAAWAELLDDYEILQPFPQLSRPIMAFTESERSTGVLARFEGAVVETKRILGMTKREWKIDPPENAGWSFGITRELPGGCVTVTLEPGIFSGAVLDSPDQKLEAVRIVEHRRSEGSASEPPTDIDPATASETLAWLARLTGKS